MFGYKLIIRGETDWGALIQNLLSGLGSAISNIDWRGILERIKGAIFEFVVQLPGIIIGALGGLSDLIGSLFEALGLDSIAGFFHGMADALADVGAWLKKNLVDPVVNTVKKMLGIHSPSTVFASIGKNIVQGLLNGLSGLKEKVVAIFTATKNAIKNPINAMIGVIETLANAVINGINLAIGALNGLSFDVPKWVPVIGGETFGFNIPELSNVSIPRLATGTVIPPNREFLAVLGDQKHGTNIEAPLDTIEQASERAILKVLSQLGVVGGDNSMASSRPVELKLMVNSHELGRVVVEEGIMQLMATGKNMFALRLT